MNYIKVTTHGLTERFTTNSLIKARKELFKILGELSLTFENKKLYHEKTIQKKFKFIKLNEKLTFKVEDSLIEIYRLKQF